MAFLNETGLSYFKSKLDAAYAAKSHTHAVSQITGLTASRALVSDSSGHPAVSAVTSTELGYLDGVTSNVQSQLNGKAATSHTHNYAGSSSAGGAANSVAQSMTIQFNGTSQSSYNGSAARTYNITPSAIGAATSGHTHSNYAASSHSHGTLHDNFTVQIANTTTDSGWSMINSTYNGYILKSIRTQQNSPSWIKNNYSAGICFGGADTKGVVSIGYSDGQMRVAGGNSTKPSWYWSVSGSNGASYNLANFSVNGHTHSYLPLSGGTLTGNLNITSAGIFIKASNIDVDTTPSSSLYSPSLQFNDKDGVRSTYVRFYKSNAGTQYLQLENVRTISGTNKYANINIGLDKSGNPTFYMNSVAAFRNALNLGNTSGAVPVANGGTGATAKGTTLLSNIGISTGTGGAPSSGTAGTIYIQYS